MIQYDHTDYFLTFSYVYSGEMTIVNEFLKFLRKKTYHFGPYVVRFWQGSIHPKTGVNSPKSSGTDTSTCTCTCTKKLEFVLTTASFQRRLTRDKITKVKNRNIELNLGRHRKYVCHILSKHIVRAEN
jgi:hypothetical protein